MNVERCIKELNIQTEYSYNLTLNDSEAQHLYNFNNSELVEPNFLNKKFHKKWIQFNIPAYRVKLFRLLLKLENIQLSMKAIIYYFTNFSLQFLYNVDRTRRMDIQNRCRIANGSTSRCLRWLWVSRSRLLAFAIRLLLYVGRCGQST